MTTGRRRSARQEGVRLVVGFVAAVLGGWLAVVAYTFVTGGEWSDTWKYLPITAAIVLLVLWMQRLSGPRQK